DDVDTVELLENESIESAGVVVLHDKITPAKSATSLLRRLMEAKLLKTKTAVLVLYSGRTLLTREQDPRESEMSGRVRQGLQEIAGEDGHVGVVRCHLELKTQQDETAGGKLPLVQKQTSTKPVFIDFSAFSAKEVLQFDVFQGKNPPAWVFHPEDVAGDMPDTFKLHTITGPRI
ncbi:unnamed protein product, partial [Ascophyllum nodosum]